MHIPDRLLGIHAVKLADRVLDVDGTSIPHLIAMAWCGAIGSVLLPVMTAAEAAMWRHNPQVAAYLASGAFDGEEIDLDDRNVISVPGSIRDVRSSPGPLSRESI